MQKLFTESEIKDRVQELGHAISSDYRGKRLTLIGILKGSFVFLADLIRAIEGDVEVDFMALSSYGDSTESTGVVRLMKDLDVDIKGRDVIIVEDIIDTGLTLNYLIHLLQQREPASVKICTLLDKSVRRQVELPLDYVGFEIEDGFVVGFGIDCAQKYRHLPFIGIVE